MRPEAPASRSLTLKVPVAGEMTLKGGRFLQRDPPGSRQAQWFRSLKVRVGSRGT